MSIKDIIPQISEEDYTKLLQNGLEDFEGNHKPVIRFYVPGKNTEWLITAKHPKIPDLFYGIADLGVGYKEEGEIFLEQILQYEIQTKSIVLLESKNS